MTVRDDRHSKDDPAHEVIAVNVIRAVVIILGGLVFAARAANLVQLGGGLLFAVGGFASFVYEIWGFRYTLRRLGDWRK